MAQSSFNAPLLQWAQKQPPDVSLFELDGRVEFVVYGPNGGLCSAACSILYVKGWSEWTPMMDGGEFPKSGEIVTSAGGWYFARVDWSPEFCEPWDVIRVLDATLAEIRGKQSTISPGIIDSLRMKWLRTKRRFALAMTA